MGNWVEAKASLSLSAPAYLLHYGSGAILHVQKEIKLKFRNSKVFSPPILSVR